MASIATGLLVARLLVAGSPAFAQQSNSAKPAAATPAHSAPYPKIARSKSSRSAAVPEAYAALPEAERLAIQSDIVWLGHYESMSAEEIDAHAVDAIKAFQKRNNGKETGVLSDAERAQLAEAAKPAQAAVGWRLLDDTTTGARLGLPEKLVPRPETARTGSRWISAQGQIQIETFRLHEASLPALFEQEKKLSQRSVGYSQLNPDSFATMGQQRLKKFVVRAQSNGSEVRGVTILYDQATEGTMAPVALAVSDTFAGFPDPNADSTLGRKRGVEYGSAIVVTSRGDLVTLGQVTDQCQSITVPGFGHAERVAEDKTNDLALLRLYGARNLVPGPLGRDGGTGDTLTLFGIADPLAQPGDNTASSAPAQLSAQGIGAVPPQATLVPAAAVRAFLQAYGITPAAGQLANDPAAMGESIVRVICVRK
jgi:hypothetical protein